MFIFNQLIDCLKNSQSISIEDFSRQLSLPKKALIAHLQKEQSLGLPLNYDNEHIFLSSKNSLLNTVNLKKNLSDFSLYYFPAMISTNDYLLQHHRQLPSLTLCLTDFQTQGRGQRGRLWVVPFAGQLTFSLLYRFPKTQNLSGLSLAVGLSLVKTLHRLGGSSVGIKWPNDLMVKKETELKKLAGILIESVSFDENAIDVIIGVGINYEEVPHAFEKATIGLKQLTPNVSREKYLTALLTDLNINLTAFNQQGFSAFHPLWQTFDVFSHQEIYLHNDKKKLYGKNLGVNAQGALQLLTAEGIKNIHQGSYSLWFE